MGFFKKQTIVGLDLGHHSIKAVQLERTNFGWRLIRHAGMPTPPECIKDGVVIDPATAGQAIRALLRDSHISATSASIAVAGGSVVVRPVRMPRMAEATLRKSIRFEASRYVPSTVDDSYIEFEILGPAEDNQMDVIVVAAPKDIVESRMNACEEAGLDVDSVDIEAFAMYRSLVEANEDQEWIGSTVAIVDIGASMTSMSVVQNGVFAMTRSIPSGGENLTLALKNYFKLSDEDAEAGKAQLDLRELMEEAPRENPPLRVVQPHVDDLIREIRRSMNYFQSQQTEGNQPKQVEMLILTGGGSNMPGLAEYVQHRLQLKAISIGVFDNPRLAHAGDVDDSGRSLAVASGLAMRAFMKAA